MLKYIKIAILIFACISVMPVKGQNNSSEFPSEEITIQTSQQLLFPGEILWFSLFSTNSLAETDLSSLAFVELINPTNTSVLRKKIKLSDGSGSGYFQLPDSLSTGVYRVVAYTNWMKNFDTKEHPFSELAIINPEQPFKPSSNVNSSINVQLSPNNKSYNKRVRIDLADLIDLNKQNKGIYSISVKHKEPKLFVPSNRENTGAKKDGNTLRFLPDYKGIVVSGMLFQANNELASNREVILSIPGNGVDLQSSTTNTNGTFSFLLSNTLANQDLVFTLPDSEMNIKLNDPFVNQHNFHNTPIIQLDSLANTFLQEKYFYWQLAQKFGNNDSESTPADSLDTSPFIFYSNPNRTFKSKDYILLDSISEYFHELIPSVHFNRIKNDFQIDIINQKNKLSLGNSPGVFVDGVLYSSFNNLAQIPTSKLDRIEVLWDKYHYKDFSFDGIVSIHTKNADFYAVDLQENMTRIIYPLSDKNGIQFKTKMYTKNSISSKRPDLRNLLYWNAAVNADEFNKLHFYTSDISGTYEITISGYTESGKWNTLSNKFEVK